MTVENCNPFIRAAEIQPAILEGTGPRKAYDHRLFYILENRGSILIDGCSYDISPDTLIIIPPAIAYDFRGKLKTCVLNYDVTRQESHRTRAICPPPAAQFESSLLFDPQVLEEFSQPSIRIAGPDVKESVLQIISLYNTRSQYADAAVSAMLKLLLAQLLQEDTAPENRVAEKVLSYIRVHAASVGSNEQLAKIFGYHPVYLAEVIKRATGKTLHCVITDAKLRLACRWLTGTDIGIADIAEATGFCSRTHFCTVFKSKFGITPTQYRKRHSPSTAKDIDTVNHSITI